MKVLIVTGGSLATDLLEKYLQKEYDYIIAADLGLAHFKDLGRQPDYILGDFDSVKASVLQYYQENTDIEIKTYPKKKNESDTHLAILHALELGAEQITLLGALGTRFDHSFANIGLLSLPLFQNVCAEVIDGHNRISMLAGPNTKKIKKSEQYGDYISLIPYTEYAKNIKLEGFLYPLQGETLTQGISMGISNQIISEEASISLEEGILLITEARD